MRSLSPPPRLLRHLFSRNPNPISPSSSSSSSSISLPRLASSTARRDFRPPGPRSAAAGSPLASGRFLVPDLRYFCSSSSSSSSSTTPARGTMAVAVSAAAAAQEGSPAKKFWIGSLKESVLAKYTPFVVCLAAGKLELDTFRAYIAQDAYFLKAFAQAYEMAEGYADDDDDKVRINELKKSVLDELKMHDSIMQEWGTDPNKEITPNPATLKYTDFLLATAAGKLEGGKVHGKIVTPFEKTKIAAYIVGAMTPCMRLYAHLGKELMEDLKNDINNHPYKKWIDTYSSQSFEAAALQTEELLERLSVSLTGEELDIIERLYSRAMKLEVDFFLSQAIRHSVVVPFTSLHDPRNHLVIFSDFDLTCTVLDSSALLAEISILSAPKSDQDRTDIVNAQMSSLDLRSSFVALSKQYTEEYEQCIEIIISSEEASKFDYEKLYNSLQLLSKFEKLANARVIDSGLLKGMKLEDIKRAGERLTLQDGCKDFFHKAVLRKKELNADLHILSYCWCADLIRSAFSSVGCLNDLSIHSNELNYDGSISTGEIVRKMESPLDKVNAFKTILNNLASKTNHLSVYIGDSVGDLLCLLEADVGIVVGSSASLRIIGNHFGISFVPLYPGLVHKQRQLQADGAPIWKGLSGVLYTVSSWAETEAFLLGP